LGKVRRQIGWRQDVVMAVAIVTGGDAGCGVGFAERHGLAVIGVPVMRQPVLVAFAATRSLRALKLFPLRLLIWCARVTIRANRAALVALGQQPAMHTLKVGFLDAEWHLPQVLATLAWLLGESASTRA